MVLVLERRAEIAIRSLSQQEQEQVGQALDEIGVIALMSYAKARKSKSSVPDRAKPSTYIQAPLV